MKLYAPDNIRVLHLTFEKGAAVRLQRYLQSNLNMGFTPIVFCRRPAQKDRKKHDPYSLWFPDQKKVLFSFYELSDFSYCLDRVGGTAFIDKIGLKRTFSRLNCQIVHAHCPESAYYSYKLGLPTVFDDWECWLDHYEYCKPVDPEPFGKSLKNLSRGISTYDLSLLRYFLQGRFRKIVLELIRKVPIIATNDEAARRYRKLGAFAIWSVPNVPMAFERDYGLAVKKQKRPEITTCYIGNLSSDSKMFLRNTSGIRELWRKNNLGYLHVFEGQNYLPHLDLFRCIQNCHFNLLFWKPLAVHRYYLQNKAFLASVMGVPTIISSSLKATINLLGDYALPVDSLGDIPHVIQSYDVSKELPFNPAHLWDYYEPNIKAAYDYALDYFGNVNC